MFKTFSNTLANSSTPLMTVDHFERGSHKNFGLFIPQVNFTFIGNFKHIDSHCQHVDSLFNSQMCFSQHCLGSSNQATPPALTRSQSRNKGVVTLQRSVSSSRQVRSFFSEQS